MIATVIITSLLCACFALACAVYLLSRESGFWRGKHDSLRSELDQINHANADAAMQRIYGKPVFGEPTEKQKAASVFELGADRAEKARRLALTQPEQGYATDDVPVGEVLTSEDLEHLEQLTEEGVQ